MIVGRMNNRVIAASLICRRATAAPSLTIGALVLDVVDTPHLNNVIVCVVKRGGLAPAPLVLLTA
jgi:hypothetical protein